MSDAYIHVYACEKIKRVSRFITGACLEDANHEVYGGIYSQKIFGESFEEDPMEIDPATNPEFAGLSGVISCLAELKIRSWQPFRKGNAVGELVLELNGTFNGKQSQRITFEKGCGEIGIENRGLNRWGMYFCKGKLYEGYVWVRVDKPVTFYVSMENSDGSKVYAERSLYANSEDWVRLDFTLTPSRTDEKGCFAVKLKEPGSIVLGHIFLQPGPWGRFKGLPVRKDIVEWLIKGGITVLRYGGAMIQSPEYRWKKMIGPRDRRPPYHGSWYKFSTNGWGIIDFLDLCEVAGFECIPDFNMDESPRDIADFVEYVKGDANTKWGRKRIEAGHPEPYNLKYIELGNEETINARYWKRFKALAEAIWDKSSDITVIVGDWAAFPIDDPFNLNWPHLKSMEYYKKILDLAKARGRPVWFDVHAWASMQTDKRGELPPIPKGIQGIKDYIYWLGKLSPGADYKVVFLEENGYDHTLQRALYHCRILNELAQLDHEIQFYCPACCLQPSPDQALLTFTSSNVWGQPLYYVTQMVSRNYLPFYVKTECESPNNALYAAAKRSEDCKTVSLEVVNLEDIDIETQITINGFTPQKIYARVIELKGEPEAINTPDQPKKIIPKEKKWHYKTEKEVIKYIFPKHSFTVIRFE